ncbi:hypothetical protein CFP56_013874 [Quercus suber]|uniref:Uncharacterized protein n=1 Tax=Quercus suber TaxID=58331 RepID=A0AAW0M422_QUESU
MPFFLCEACRHRQPANPLPDQQEFQTQGACIVTRNYYYSNPPEIFQQKASQQIIYEKDKKLTHVQFKANLERMLLICF